MLVIIMLLWLGAGFLGAMETIRIANLAHLGGLIAGLGLGWFGQDWDRRSSSNSRSNSAKLS